MVGFDLHFIEKIQRYLSAKIFKRLFLPLICNPNSFKQMFIG
jgi:hypothetical protein